MTEDTRDMRDPKVIGEIILKRDKEHYPSASEFVDAHLHKYNIPDVDPGESTCTLTQREYKEDLIVAAMGGDVYAHRRLVEIDEEAARVVSRERTRTNETTQSSEFMGRARETLRRAQEDDVQYAVPPVARTLKEGDSESVLVSQNVNGAFEWEYHQCTSTYSHAPGVPMVRCGKEFDHAGYHTDGVYAW